MIFFDCRLPDCFFCHFLEGNDLSDVSNRSFVQYGREFFIAALVQYRPSPVHFVCHLRHPIGSYFCILL